MSKGAIFHDPPLAALETKLFAATDTVCLNENKNQRPIFSDAEGCLIMILIRADFGHDGKPSRTLSLETFSCGSYTGKLIQAAHARRYLLQWGRNVWATPI